MIIRIRGKLVCMSQHVCPVLVISAPDVCMVRKSESFLYAFEWRHLWCSHYTLMFASVSNSSWHITEGEIAYKIGYSFKAFRSFACLRADQFSCDYSQSCARRCIDVRARSLASLNLLILVFTEYLQRLVMHLVLRNVREVSLLHKRCGLFLHVPQRMPVAFSMCCCMCVPESW